MYAEVIIPLALPKNYTWSVPEQWRLQIREGCRVEVELKNKKYAGIVKRLHQDKPAAFEPKAIGNVLDAEPILHPAQLKLWEWIASYYLCSEGEVMAAALPAHFKLSSETILVFNEENGDDFTHLDHDEYIVAEALTIKRELKLTEVQQLLDSSHVYPVIKRLIEKRVCFVWEALKETYSAKKESYVLLNSEYHSEDKLAKLLNDWDPPSAAGKSSGPRAPKQLELLLAYLHLSRTQGEVTKPDLLKKAGASDAQLKGLVEKNILWIERRSVHRLKYMPRDITIDFELSPAQNRAFQEIGLALEQRSVCLLHGVTASGKTEVYIRQMELTVRQGRQVLYLLPEIALTSQIIRRLQKHFGGFIGIYHSKFSQNERLEIWNKIRTGELKIILGARSSIFLPFEDLGLIVADEEHDSSYKQQEPAPRYNARDAAIYYASLFKAKVLLGSATPSVETYYNASSGKYGLAELSERFGQVQLPDITIIDTKLLRPAWNNYKDKDAAKAARNRVSRSGPERYDKDKGISYPDGSPDFSGPSGVKGSADPKGSKRTDFPEHSLFSDNPIDDLFGSTPSLSFPGQAGPSSSNDSETPYPNTIDPHLPRPAGSSYESPESGSSDNSGSSGLNASQSEIPGSTSQHDVPSNSLSGSSSNDRDSSDKTSASRDNSKVILSPQLREAIEQSLTAGKQVILFQNRRGYSPYQVCEVCGWIPQCRNCDVSLSFHKLTNKLHCHYCGTVYPPLNTCAACGNHRFVQRNFGTERIEEFLEEIFPKARVARMDIDSVRGKTAHDSLIQQFEQQRIDILVGTQMVVKGLDFEHVNLVGILDADSILSFADFRVNERAFQLMEQVSGRAGRKDGEGRVLIQVANTGHPVLSYLKTHDYRVFFEHEIAARQQFFYPPFSRVIMITFRHRDKEVVQSAAHFFANNLKGDFGKYLVGPAEPAVGRVRNQYLMELLLKLPKDGHTINFAKQVIQQQTAILHNDRKFRGVVVIPDVDAL